MKIFKAGLGAFALAISTTTLFAADMPRPMAVPIMAAAPAEDFSGWYLRGDMAVANQSHHNNTRVGVPAGWTASSTSHGSTASPTSMSMGVGYNVNNWLRVDGTLEYRGAARHSFRESYTTAALTGVNNVNGNLSSIVGMVNVYADIGTWAGITPYVGAGIGFARNSFGPVSIDGQTVCGACVTPTIGHMNAGTATSLAWGLMAGIALDISRNAKLDMGYRFTSLGHASSGSSYTDQANCNCTVPTHKVNGIYSHDFRLGLRWQMAGGYAPVAQEPAPLMRKF
jgi:opacity protein-like surface antigen